MTKKIFSEAVIFILSGLLAVSCGDSSGNVDYVNPNIGGVGFILQPTRPTVQLPNQMIRLSPLRDDLLDEYISCYPLALTSHRLSSVFGFLPVKDESARNTLGKKSLYDNEITTPYIYTADLEGASLSYSCSARSAVFKVSFDDSVPGEGFLRFSSLDAGCRYWLNRENALEGEASFSGMKAYLYAEFDEEVRLAFAGADSSAAVLSLPEGRNEVTMRYGLSFISCDQAKANLETEIPSFDLEGVAATARKLWNTTLGKIEVKGGTDDHRTVFYTALYRCSERMVDINEYGRYYSGFDHKVHAGDRPFYTDNWLWDTHIALEPLQTVLNPAQEEDKIASYIEMYRQYGEMPSFAVVWGDWPAMTGNYSAVWFADALCKGLEFDVETAYEGSRKNSLERTHIPWRNGPLTEIDEFYNERGYFPSLHQDEPEPVKEVDTVWEKRQAVAVTTANSYADWGLAQMCRL